MTRILSLLIMMAMSGCATFPESFDPAHAGVTLDEAAVNCLDWVWYRKSYVVEMAGGVFKTQDGYACGRITTGTPLSVVSFIPKSWAARFHTHSLPKTQVSKQDMHNVREDPRHQPSYIRLRPGTVIAYECRDTKKGKMKCAGRRVR